MLTNRTENLDPSDIFQNMVLSSAFEPRSASIEEKMKIFGEVWAGSIPDLLSNYGSDGRESRSGDSGFGFLVEGFANSSARMPKRNTQKGNDIARSILASFRSGRKSRFIKFNRSMANSDFLWLKQTGRLITIIGIAEVKSSYRTAFEKVGGQLKLQEKSLDVLVEEFNAAKNHKQFNDFFQKRKIVVSKQLEKLLVVPFGEGEAAKRDKKFSEWRVIELEFSYNELVFIAKQIWPDFRPDIRIGPGRLSNFFEVANGLAGWIQPRIDRILGNLKEFNPSDPFPYFELGLFFLATAKTPLTEGEVSWSAELVRNVFWPSIQKCSISFIDSKSSELILSERELKMFQRFWYNLTKSKDDLANLIIFARYLNEEIKESVRSRNQIRRLKIMQEVLEL